MARVRIHPSGKNKPKIGWIDVTRESVIAALKEFSNPPPEVAAAKLRWIATTGRNGTSIAIRYDNQLFPHKIVMRIASRENLQRAIKEKKIYREEDGNSEQDRRTLSDQEILYLVGYVDHIDGGYVVENAEKVSRNLGFQIEDVTVEEKTNCWLTKRT
jgi:hypothetical protein